MAVLLLRLAGPLQSWGAASRFTRRDTMARPTKSGVLGLLAAAEGRRRSDPIEDLAALRFGVRIDQPGRLTRDFQTAIRWTSAKRESMPLSYRYYLSDAVFVAAVEGDVGLVRSVFEAVRAPAFPLYLGRRSCVPTLPVAIGVVEADLEDALRSVPWQAADWHRRRLPRGVVPLEIFVDAPPGGGDGVSDTVRDVPQSWDPRRREYGWREVIVADPGAEVDNPHGRVMPNEGPFGSEPDFLAEVGGVPCI